MSKKVTNIKKVYMTEAQYEEFKQTNPTAVAYNESVCIDMRCDHCGKHIPDGARYVTCFTGESDSFEHLDFCSEACSQAWYEYFKMEHHMDHAQSFAHFDFNEIARYTELGDD